MNKRMKLVIAEKKSAATVHCNKRDQVKQLADTFSPPFPHDIHRVIHRVIHIIHRIIQDIWGRTEKTQDLDCG